MNNISLSR